MDNSSTSFAWNQSVLKCLPVAAHASKNLITNIGNFSIKCRTTPLKKVIADAREKEGNSKVGNFNSDVMINILEGNQKKAYEVIMD